MAAVPTPSPDWRLGELALSFPPPLGVGVVNVTDDSFYPEARSGTPRQAIEDGLRLAEAGFELLDVGAVAARSGPPVDPAEEAARLVPAVEGLRARTTVPVLADTFSVEVAAAVLDAGADGINDISGAADPALLELVAERRCGYVLMHIEGPPRIARRPLEREDVVAHLKTWFRERLETAAKHGVEPQQIALDPGLDFDLTTAGNLEILRRIGELRELGRPLFLAASRKDFLGAVLAGSWERRLGPEHRGPATMAAVALAAAAGAELFRLHDPEALDAIRVAAAIAEPGLPARDG